MYIPNNYKIDDVNIISRYIEENSFGTLISYQEGKPIATHIPMLLVERGGEKYLQSHISIANEQKIALANGSEVLAIFMEKHTYISSSWYDHINVPTWNYIAVHIYGKATILDEAATKVAIDDMVCKYEKGNAKPFHTRQMEDKEYHAHLKGLVCFEISIDRIEAAWKLSQNRDDKNHAAIIQQLLKRGDALSVAIAEEMQKMRGV